MAISAVRILLIKQLWSVDLGERNQWLSLLRSPVTASLLPDDVHGQRNHRADVAERRRKNHRIAFVCQFAELGQVVLGDRSCTASNPPGC